MIDIWGFQKELNAFIEDEIPREWKRRVIDIICFLYDGIISRNPVAGNDPDTKKEYGIPGGFSKGNWKVDLGISDDVEGSRENPPSPLSDNDIRSKLGVLKMKNPDIVWVYNNAKYIQALEDGHSRQAPRGMVSSAVSQTRAFMVVYAARNAK